MASELGVMDPDKKDKLFEEWWKREGPKWADIEAYKPLAKSAWNACFHLLLAERRLLNDDSNGGKTGFKGPEVQRFRGSRFKG